MWGSKTDNYKMALFRRHKKLFYSSNHCSFKADFAWSGIELQDRHVGILQIPLFLYLFKIMQVVTSWFSIKNFLFSFSLLYLFLSKSVSKTGKILCHNFFLKKLGEIYRKKRNVGKSHKACRRIVEIWHYMRNAIIILK